MLCLETGYTEGWSSITAVDLDGGGQDEIFFYRDDGLVPVLQHQVRWPGGSARFWQSGTGYYRRLDGDHRCRSRR